MALPSSGAISLSAIASEFGDSTPNSISEFYRGGSLVPNSSTNSNVPTSGQISFNQFYGAADSVWTTNLTVGIQSGKSNTLTGFIEGSFGSLSDNTVDFKSGAICRSISWGSATQVVALSIDGNLTNAGFTTMTFNGNSFNRTDASYQYVPNGNPQAFTSWSWSQSTNPFSTTGSVDTVTFT